MHSYHDKHGAPLTSLGLEFVEESFYNSEGYVEYKYEKFYLRVGIEVGSSIGLAFGRKWTYPRGAGYVLSNRYPAFLDYFGIEEEAQFNLRDFSMDEAFGEVYRVLDKTLRQISSLLNEDTIREIEEMKYGAAYIWEQ